MSLDNEQDNLVKHRNPIVQQAYEVYLKAYNDYNTAQAQIAQITDEGRSVTNQSVASLYSIFEKAYNSYLAKCLMFKEHPFCNSQFAPKASKITLTKMVMKKV